MTRWPRTRPSVRSMAMQRMLLSPQCCATSSTRRMLWSCTSRADMMAGSSPVSKRTSTTGPGDGASAGGMHGRWCWCVCGSGAADAWREVHTPLALWPAPVPETPAARATPDAAPADPRPCSARQPPEHAILSSYPFCGPPTGPRRAQGLHPGG